MRHSFLLGLVAGLAITACGSQAPTDVPPPPLAQTIIIIVNGDGQSGTVAAPLPSAIVARAVDSLQLPMKGVIISWVVTSGGGSVFAPTTQTGDSGYAKQLWTLGTAAGPQTLEARAIDPNTGQPITFTKVKATGVAGPVAYAGFKVKTALLTGDSVWTPPVTATDLYGNPVAAPPIVGLDGRSTDKTGQWVAYPLGVTRFQLSGPNETDTLAATVVPRLGHFTATWSDGTQESGVFSKFTFDTTGSNTSFHCGSTGRGFYYTADSVTYNGNAIGGGWGGDLYYEASAPQEVWMLERSSGMCRVAVPDTLAGRWVFDGGFVTLTISP